MPDYLVYICVYITQNKTMNFRTINYSEYEKDLPQEGKYILAQQTDEHILVYQAFRPSIANYAIKNQAFGGNDYSYNRMSWIKPNFLWMMYRSGWAAKPGQEKILGIWLTKTNFEKILANSTFTSFAQSTSITEQEWRSTLETHPVRLQWDPDHLPNGEKHTRKAIQLGIKGELLEEFGKRMIVEIIDLSDFANEQKQYADAAPYKQLMVAEESVYFPSSKNLMEKVGINQELPSAIFK